MKPAIHPNWYPDAVVTCACGNSWTTGSTKKEIHTDVCNKCHPFFTGEQRIVDTAGQVERFMKRITAKEQIAATQPAVEEKRAKKEKRRERRTGGPEAPAPAAPTELPLAEAQPAPVAATPQTEAAPGPDAEVAPMVAPENYKAMENADIPPAGMVGSAASVDKIIEPAETPAQAKPRAPRKPRKPAAEKPQAAEPNKEEEPK